MTNSELHNFAGYNTASALENSTKELIVTLEQGNQTTTAWFKTNETIINLDEFQVVIVRRNNPVEDLYKLNVGEK